MTTCRTLLSPRALIVCAAAALAMISGARPDRAENTPAPATAAAVPATAAAAPSEPLTPERAAEVWQELTDRLGYKLAKCQWVLLGTRSPQGPSCVNLAWGHTKYILPTGGPGTRLAITLLVDMPRRKPSDDFRWSQTTLKETLKRMQADNREALAVALRLSDLAEELRRGLTDSSALPSELRTADLPDRTNWIGHCAHELDDAIGRCDPAACRRWADELASAAFALADLHRWLDFLLANHLAAIAFQAKCETLFAECDTLYGDRYESSQDQPWFPTMQLVSRGKENYMEVERQAEWLMRVPPEYLVKGPDERTEARADGVASVPAAIWMPPNLRAAFVELRSHLSPANREIWDAAAHSPFDRAFLANMLFRASEAGTLDATGVVLERFSRLRPQATQPALMGAIFYRGGATMSPGEWDSRFDRRLMLAAEGIKGTDEQVLLHAQRFTRELLGGPWNYGPVMSTRQALDTGRMDCLTATDIIGSLYRNAGRTSFFQVRWCAGTSAHTVAAAEVNRGDRRAIVLADGLADPQTTAEQWPDAYVGGHTWPSGYVGDRPDIYSAELYVRGIDDYVWLQGYIVRGPNAGTLIDTGIPYLPRHAQSQAERADTRRPPSAPAGKRG